MTDTKPNVSFDVLYQLALGNAMVHFNDSVDEFWYELLGCGSVPPQAWWNAAFLLGLDHAAAKEYFAAHAADIEEFNAQSRARGFTGWSKYSTGPIRFRDNV